MAKTYVQRIAEVVAQKHNLSMKDAETFVSAMFAVAHEGMEQDKLVKIKGLGTFKVVAVKSRESVNVNTGERIVLEGHDKVSFTPDTAMKELVNKPFAQFEAVVLNDGVDLEDIDRQQEEQPKAEQPAEGSLVEEKREEENPVQEQEPVEQPTVKVPIEEPLQNERPKDAGQRGEHECSAKEAEPTDEQEEEHEDAHPQEDVAFQKDDSEDVVSQEQTTDGDSRSAHRRMWALLMLGVLIVAAVIGYFWYNQKQNETALPPLPKSMTERAKPIAAKKNIAKPAALPDTRAAAVARANQDPRVRIGGYDIVGIDTVITLRGNQTMHSYCRHTLGKDMIVYFQALNGKDSMSAGEQMRVPKVKFRTSN